MRTFALFETFLQCTASAGKHQHMPHFSSFEANPNAVAFLGVSFWVNDTQMEMLVGLDSGGKGTDQEECSCSESIC